MATFATVISGVLVFVLCEYIKEIWLKPLQEYRQLKRKVSYLLANYAMYYCNPIVYQTSAVESNTKYQEAAQELREAACELRGFIEVLPRFHLGIPPRDNLYNATENMIGLSNSFFCPASSSIDTITNNRNRAKLIRDNLKIFTNNEQ